MLEEQTLALNQCLASLANWWGIRAAIQFTSITSPKHRAHMQVSSSDHCERAAILSNVSVFAKGQQINEECLICNVESWESLSLADTSDLVLGRAILADAAVWQASRNPIATSYQESRCLFRFENEPSIKQLLPCWKNKKLPSFNILPVVLIQWAFEQQSNSHQSPVPNIEHTCRVSSNDHCDRAILSTVSVFAKGQQINEECLICNVESWESLSLADTSDLVLGRALVADAAVWQASRNPNATSYQESRCLFRFENEPSIKQLLPCWNNHNLPSFNILPVLLIQWAFVQQSSSHQSPVPNIQHTCRYQAATTVRDLFSPLFPFLQRVSRSMKSVSFAMLKAEKVWAYWCCCVTGFQESYCYQLPRITLPFPVRERAEHRTTFAMLEEQTLALNQCLASLANSMGIRAEIQFTSITSPKQRAHMQVSSSDHCDRVILSTVSIFAKGQQINEECLICNIESWESLSLLMLLCDRLPGILLLPATRNHVAFSGSRMSRASNNFCHAGITTTCPRSISCQSCQSPVPNVEHTCRCQAVTTVTEPFSPLFPFFQRVSRSMKSVSFAMLKAEKAWAWQTPQTLCWEEL